jgi:ParB-like chromosome segregation protein Spo0J
MSSEEESLADGYVPETPGEVWPGQWVPREEIEPNDWNPNEMTDEQRERLYKSLMDNGWTQPIVIHAEEHYIIDGEQRWHVAGREEFAQRADVTPDGVSSGYVPVFGITVDDDHAKVATVQHNRARGKLDANRLQDYLSQLRQRRVMDDVLDRIGVKEDMAKRLLDEVTAKKAVGETAEFSAPWEPVDRTHMEEDAVGETRSREVKEAVETHYEEDVSEMDEDRAAAIVETTTRCNFVMTESQAERVMEVVGNTNEAESVLNLIRYFIANELVDEVNEEFDYNSVPVVGEISVPE